MRRTRLAAWRAEQERANLRRYGAHLYVEGERSALSVPVVAPAYADDAPVLNGFEVLNACFDAHLGREPRLLAFGEDVGRLGDVNQGFAGLQDKHGVVRVGDTGIREATIIGQAIGLAMRGLRPIAEIQYLDYLLYALQILSDDLATLSYRSAGTAARAGHRAHARPPAGGDLALGLADGRHPEPGARPLGLRAARHDAGRRHVQHAAARRRPGDRRRGAQRLPREGAAAAATSPTSRCRSACRRCCGEGSDVTVVSYGATLRIVIEAAELLATRRRRGRGRSTCRRCCRSTARA